MKEGMNMREIIDLNIEFERNNAVQSIHPVVLRDDQHIILVDTAYPGFLSNIEDALIKKDINPQDLTHVFITHHDIDHMGALYELLEKYPNIKVVSSDIESDFISGNKKSLRLIKMEEMLQDASEDQKPLYEAFCERLKAIKHVEVDIKVQYDDILDWLGGTKVIHTPGHMPYHVSLYIEKEKAVITGDAAYTEKDHIQTVGPQFTLDMKDAKESLDKLLKLDAKRYFCFHGGLYIKA